MPLPGIPLSGQMAEEQAVSRNDKAGEADQAKSKQVSQANTEVAQELAPGQNQGPEINRLVQTWLQSDPKTLAGLRSFLEVEFSHYPTDHQTFQTLQIMTMLKRAREILEDQKLRETGEGKSVSEPTDDAERALLAASFMGAALHTLRKKKIGKLTNTDIETASAGVDIAADEAATELLACLGEVLQYLKKAEAGLQRAMAQGIDNRRLRGLIHKVLDVCADIIEIQQARQHIPA